MTRPANSELVTVAWLKTAAGIGNGMVSTTLPADNTTWAASGFVVVGPQSGGAPHARVPYRSPVMQLDCYAVSPNTDNPPWGLASDLAEFIVTASLDDTLLGRALTLRSGYEQARVTGVTVQGGPRRLYGDPASYAHYQLDLEINWIPI